MSNSYIKPAVSVEWSTPQGLFNWLDSEYHFQLDPCASVKNHKTDSYFTIQDDGLKQDWSPHGSVFMNPPYGRKIGDWIKKAYEESQKGCVVVCLLPSRTDTKWWHDYCMKGQIEFLLGRLKFSKPDGTKGRCPFASVVVVFDGR